MQLSKRVTADKLAKGMSLAEDLFGYNGALLVAEGYTIANIHVFRSILKNNNIDTVQVYCEPYVYGPGESPSGITLHESDIFRRIEEKYTSERLELVKDFDDLLEGKPTTRPVLDKHFDRTMELLKLCSNVFQLIEVFSHLDKSVYAYGYNLALLAYKIGVWYKLSPGELKDLFLTALLADVGNVKASDWNDREHVIISYKAVKDYSFLSETVKHSILMHHERKDGSGFPFKKRGSEIGLYARIIAVSDTYNRLCKKNRNALEVIGRMQSEYLGLLDEDILYTLYNSISNSFVGQIVKLNDGEVGEIIFLDNRNIFRPIVKTLSGKFINLADPKNNHLVISEFIIPHEVM